MKKGDVIDRLKGKYERAIENRNLFGVGSNGWMANEVRAVSYNIAIDLIKKIEEEAEPAPKVEVPDFVAEWYEANKSSLESNIAAAFRRIGSDEHYTKGPIYEWLNDSSNEPIQTLFKMKDGYNVRQKRWVVRFESRYTYYFSGWCTENPLDPNGFRSKNDSKVMIFDNKGEADKLAEFIDGTVVEI